MIKFISTFQTKKRDWYGLVSILNYGSNYSNVLEICKKLYEEIMERIKKRKTDGVIIEYNGEKLFGTIGLNNKFIPFQENKLTVNEKLNAGISNF